MLYIWYAKHMALICYTDLLYNKCKTYVLYIICYANAIRFICFVYHNLSLSKLPPRTKSSTQSKKHHWPPISLATAAGSLINSVKAAAPGTHGRVFAGCCCQRAYSKGTGESLNTYPYGTSEDNFHLPFFSYIRQKGTCGKN